MGKEILGLHWRYEASVRGETLFRLFRDSLQRRFDLTFTAIGSQKKEVVLTPDLVTRRLQGEEGELKFKGKRDGRVLVKATVWFDAKEYPPEFADWNRCDASGEFSCLDRGAPSCPTSAAAIRSIFVDMCGTGGLKWADGDSDCIFGHKRYGELQDAWKSTYTDDKLGHGVGWLTYYSNAYLSARGQGEALLTNAGLTIFKRLSHGVLTQTDEVPLADPDAYIDRLITIARALRVPNRRPDPPPKPQPPGGPGYYVTVKTRAKKTK